MQSSGTRNRPFVRRLRIRVAALIFMVVLAGMGGVPARYATASPDIVISDFSGDASAGYLVFGEIFELDSSHFDPPSTVATAAVEFGGGATDAGKAAAFQSALGINAVEASSNFSAARQARFDARTSFFVEVTNADFRDEIPITFKFVINGGEVRVENLAGLNDPLQFIGAHVFARIHILGISGGGIWEFPLRLTTDGNGNPVLLNEIIGRSTGIRDDFGVGTPNVRGPFFDGNAIFFTIDRFEAEVPLGVLGARDSFQIFYEMDAEVDVEGSAPIGGLAAIGDPFSLSSGGGGAGGELLVNGMDLGQFPFGVPSPAVSVVIDVKPGSDRNPINLKSRDDSPVAILTTSANAGDPVDFDATTIDPLSVAFGPNGATEAHGKGHVEDVDGDGDDDLLLHFRTQETGIQCGDTQVVLTGETFDGQSIEGVDVVDVIGC